MKYLLLLLCLACTSNNDRYARRNIMVDARVQDGAIDPSHILYTKDTRVNLCYAQGWGGMANGGPIFTNVPCDVIPDSLFTNLKNIAR